MSITFWFAFYCCDKHHDQKQRGRKRVIQLILIGHDTPLGRVRTGAQTGGGAETMGERCVQAHSLPGLHSPGHLPRSATHSGLGPPTLITNQNNPSDTATDQSVLGRPSSQETLGYIKLTIKSNQHIFPGALFLCKHLKCTLSAISKHVVHCYYHST